MSEQIQRYEAYDARPAADGNMVTYDDHLAAIAAARAELYSMDEMDIRCEEARAEGQRDEREKWMSNKKRIPYTEDYIVHVEDVIKGTANE